MAKSKLRQLVRFPADSCPWVGKLRTVLPLTNRDVIRDSAVQLGLTHQRGAIGADSPGRIGGWFEGRGLSTSRVSPPGPLSCFFNVVSVGVQRGGP
jgi:hypothetical protein